MHCGWVGAEAMITEEEGGLGGGGEDTEMWKERDRDCRMQTEGKGQALDTSERIEVGEASGREWRPRDTGVGARSNQNTSPMGAVCPENSTRPSPRRALHKELLNRRALC